MRKENQTNDKNLDHNKRKKKLPNKIFYSVAGSFFGLGCVAIVALIVFFIIECVKHNASAYQSLAIGVAGSLFSAGILLNAIGSHIYNNRKATEESTESKQKAIIESINIFNDSIIHLFSFTKAVQMYARTLLNSNAQIKPKASLEPQDNVVLEFEEKFTDENEYNNALIRSTIVYLSTEPNTLSEQFSTYLSKVNSGNKDFPLNKDTIGCSFALKFYHERRIRVLNFFESLAIQYMNNLVDRSLMDSQFKNTIIEVVKMFYYDIYKNEGNGSYPSLLMLCEIYK